MGERETVATLPSDETADLLAAAKEMLDASAGIMGAYQAWLHTGDAAAAERLDRFDAAWANLHLQANGSSGGAA